jgi:hypothetical protein
MSFVTVFTVSAMGFVLLAPILMVTVLVLSHAQLRRPELQPARVEVSRDPAQANEHSHEHGHEVSRAAA